MTKTFICYFVACLIRALFTDDLPVHSTLFQEVFDYAYYLKPLILTTKIPSANHGQWNFGRCGGVRSRRFRYSYQCGNRQGGFNGGGGVILEEIEPENQYKKALLPFYSCGISHKSTAPNKTRNTILGMDVLLTRWVKKACKSTAELTNR